MQNSQESAVYNTLPPTQASLPAKKKKKNGCCVTPLLPALFGYHVTKIYHPLKNSPEKIHALIG